MTSELVFKKGPPCQSQSLTLWIHHFSSTIPFFNSKDLTHKLKITI